MSLWSLSNEKIEELNAEWKKKNDDFDTLSGTHIYALWSKDLDVFLEAL